MFETLKITAEIRDVPGFPGYLVSNDGRLYSCRTNAGKVGRILRERKPFVTDDGYRSIKLHRGGFSFLTGIHSIVLMAFAGPRPDGAVARHLNGIRTDNRFENLCWGSPQENADDRDRHGTTAKREGHGRAKLTEALVERVRSATDRSGASLARELGMCRSTINRIRRGKLWFSVPTPAQTFAATEAVLKR